MRPAHLCNDVPFHCYQVNDGGWITVMHALLWQSQDSFLPFKQGIPPICNGLHLNTATRMTMTNEWLAVKYLSYWLRS